ncbi:MAG: AMP-binding protein [Candidatus Riflebacteria bacterium]|nr:AMP-binding protein [Candidatus Riflebacteria bacterium]
MSLLDKYRNKAIGFFDGKDKRNNVVSLIERHVQEKPDTLAFMWPDPANIPAFGDKIEDHISHQSLSFRNFQGLIQRTAQGLLNTGIKPGDRVILFVPMSVPLYQTMAALQMIGASAVFLDSWARRDQLGVSARIVDARAFITVEKAFEFCAGESELAKIPIRIVVGPHQNKFDYHGDLARLQMCDPMTEPVAVNGDDTALITFTTGSSGTPKGANRTHEFLAAQHYALNKCIPYARADIDLPAFPMFSLNNLAAGVTTIIPITDAARPSEKDAVMVVSQILSTKVTCATLSISMMTGAGQFCAERGITLPLIRRLITGGAAVSPDLVKLTKKMVPNAELLVLYGSTEVEPIAHIEAAGILDPKRGLAPQKGVNVGHFTEDLEYKFIRISSDTVALKNDDWEPWELPNGEVGELVVAGLHVCNSYFNDPDAVVRAKIIESSGKVWHRTGDVGYLDPAGDIWLVGRVHNVIFRDGVPLFPVQVEFLLKNHPGVKQGAFLGMPDSRLGEKAYVVVELNETARSQSASLLKEIETTLKRHSIPFDYLGVVDSIPMDPRHRSKVEYGILRDLINKK